MATRLPQKGPKTSGKRLSSLRLLQSRKRSHDGSLLAEDDQEGISRQTSPVESLLGSLFESAHSHQSSDDEENDDGDDEDRESAPKVITISEDGQGGGSSDENEATPARNSNENGSVSARGSHENESAPIQEINGNKTNGTRETNGTHPAASGAVDEEAESQDQAQQERERQAKELQEREAFERERERQERAKYQLVTALMQITEHSSGLFATHGHFANAFNPGLSVIGIGAIGLPISPIDAQRLKTIGRQLPSARINSTATVGPTMTVGRIWELWPLQFELRNPAWGQGLKEILCKVAPALGISPDGSGVRPELQRLFLYEQGAFTDLRKEYVFPLRMTFLPFANCTAVPRNLLTCLAHW